MGPVIWDYVIWRPSRVKDRGWGWGRNDFSRASRKQICPLESLLPNLWPLVSHIIETQCLCLAWGGVKICFTVFWGGLKWLKCV